MLDKYEWCKQTTINPKVQAIFVHVLVNVIFKYMLQVNFFFNNNNTNTSVLGQLKFIMDVMKLWKMVAYISIHYCDSMITRSQQIDSNVT
jgi:hypothetical protein